MDIAHIIWWVGLVVTVVAVIPLAVYLLHRALRAAQEIEQDAAAALEAGLGIAGNTANIAALQNTIAIAATILGTAEQIESHTGTIKSVLLARAGRG
jgi:hypothetical protein